jgi:hypothetical protein
MGARLFGGQILIDLINPPLLGDDELRAFRPSAEFVPTAPVADEADHYP